MSSTMGSPMYRASLTVKKLMMPMHTSILMMEVAMEGTGKPCLALLRRERISMKTSRADRAIPVKSASSSTFVSPIMVKNWGRYPAPTMVNSLGKGPFVWPCSTTKAKPRKTNMFASDTINGETPNRAMKKPCHAPTSVPIKSAVRKAKGMATW